MRRTAVDCYTDVKKPKFSSHGFLDGSSCNFRIYEYEHFRKNFGKRNFKGLKTTKLVPCVQTLTRNLLVEQMELKKYLKAGGGGGV